MIVIVVMDIAILNVHGCARICSPTFCCALCAGKPRGMRTARTLRNRRRVQKWADKQYKKAHLGTRWKANPFGGSSHAKGIVVEKLGIEAKQVGFCLVCSPSCPFLHACIAHHG